MKEANKDTPCFLLFVTQRANLFGYVGKSDPQRIHLSIFNSLKKVKDGTLKGVKNSQIELSVSGCYFPSQSDSHRHPRIQGTDILHVELQPVAGASACSFKSTKKVNNLDEFL